MSARALVFLPSVLVLWLAGVSLAQTPAPTVVHWQSGAPNSDLIVRNGLQIVILEQEGLSVRATLTASEGRQVALIGVINNTDHRVEVIPSYITLNLTQPEGKPFPYMDPDKLAEKEL